VSLEETHPQPLPGGEPWECPFWGMGEWILLIILSTSQRLKIMNINAKYFQLWIFLYKRQGFIITET